MENLYDITVIGAGPAGIIAISEFLDVETLRIAWIDPQFEQGDMSKYRDIPSNTMAQTFLNVAQNSSWIQRFKHIHDTTKLFENFDPENYISLEYCYQLFDQMMDIFKQTTQNRLSFIHSIVTEARQTENNHWVLSLENGDKITTKIATFCIGGVPRKIQDEFPHIFAQFPHLQFVPLLSAMKSNEAPHQYQNTDIVAVFGYCHSGVLALKNMYNLPNDQRPKLMYLFYKTIPTLAERDENGFMKYDGTGLKGDTAFFARDHLRQNLPDFIKLIESSEETMKQYLPSCTKYVSAIGYRRRYLPKVILKSGEEMLDEKVVHDVVSAKLIYKTAIEGLFGFGMAFPGKQTCVLGIVADAIAIKLFMPYSKKVLHEQMLPLLK